LSVGKSSDDYQINFPTEFHPQLQLLTLNSLSQ